MISKSIKYLLNLTLVALIALATTGCFRDDLSGCYNNRIALSYKSDSNTEVLPDYIQSVQLFIYNASTSELYQQRTIAQNELQAAVPIVDSHLPVGQYKVYAIANMGERTQVEGYEECHRAVLGEPNAFQSDASLSGNDHIYLGYLEFNTRDLFDSVVDTLHFQSAHINLNCTFDLGQTNQDNPNDYSVLMSDMPAQIFASGDAVSKKNKVLNLPLVLSTKSDKLFYECHVASLRFAEFNDISVTLYNNTTNNAMYQFQLAAYISKFKIELSGLNEVDFNMHFTARDYTINVSPWISTPVNPIF